MTFIPNDRLETVGDYISYTIPVTISSGELLDGDRRAARERARRMRRFSEVIRGTAAAWPNPLRFDVRGYRGTGGSPPNSITYRAWESGQL